MIDDDKEMIAIAQDELKKYETELREVETKIIEATVEKDPNDREMFIWRFELAPVGGGCNICWRSFKMYSRFSERNKWDIEVINSNISDHGGLKR